MRLVKILIGFTFLGAFVFMSMRSDNVAIRKKVIIGYVGGYKGLADLSKIDANKLTHINYAFINVKNNRAFLNREATDTVNFQNLNKLKKVNPDIKILISITDFSITKPLLLRFPLIFITIKLF